MQGRQEERGVAFGVIQARRRSGHSKLVNLDSWENFWGQRPRNGQSGTAKKNIHNISPRALPPGAFTDRCWRPRVSLLKLPRKDTERSQRCQDTRGPSALRRGRTRNASPSGSPFGPCAREMAQVCACLPQSASCSVARQEDWELNPTSPF